VTDRRAFRSGQLPTAHFNERFSDENLSFWVPLIIECGSIAAGETVLDVGCGTGGFSAAIASASAANVVGVDQSRAFIDFARDHHRPQRGCVDWVNGDAEELPFGGDSFDRVVLSFVLHQLPEPERAVREAARVMRTGGSVLVRTIAPEDAAGRVPARFFPSMAAADQARMPPVAQIKLWLSDAGLRVGLARRVLRNARLTLAEQVSHAQIEVRSRYAGIGEEELQEGLRRMREDAVSHGGEWIDPRPTTFLTARNGDSGTPEGISFMRPSG
jgi:ubiquinone/menaquinone biosynthesis C-methylase UbiE